MKKSTFYSKLAVEISKTAIFSMSTLLGTLKMHRLLYKMVLRSTKLFSTTSGKFAINYRGLKMKNSTFSSKLGVEIPKIAIFSISTLLGTFKIHILLEN